MRRAIDPRVLDLNPAFLLARRIAPLSMRGQVLQVGMRDLGDGDTIAALRFATGLEIEPVAMAEAEWLEWSADLASQDEAPAGDPVAIEVGADLVHVRSPDGLEKSFPLSGRAAWRQLRAELGERRVLVLTLRDEVTWPVDVADQLHDAEALRRGIAARSPLRPAMIVWSAPVSRVPGRTSVRGVRKDWLDRRIAVIERELRPAALTIVDAAGGRFDYRPLRERRGSGLAAAVGGSALAIAAVMAGYWAARPMPMPRAEAPAQMARAPVVAVPLVPTPQLAAPPPEAVSSAAEHFELVGIVGRLPVDAVALVRPPWGRTVTLRVGDSLLGWKLASISADRVVLAKGSARQELVIEQVPAG